MNMKCLAFAKRYPVITYFILVFGISWGLILILAGPGNIPLEQEQSKSLLPLLYVMMLVGPSAAGVLLISLVYGKEGFRNFKTRLFRWQVGMSWSVFSLLGTPFLSSFILLILSRISLPKFNIAILYSEDKTTIILTGLMTGIMVGFFEEIGWSGLNYSRSFH